MVIERWCWEVDEIEKRARMREGKWRKKEVVRDWSKLTMCERSCRSPLTADDIHVYMYSCFSTPPRTSHAVVWRVLWACA